jgi:soluble lytic murein transglycosylase-like protein
VNWALLAALGVGAYLVSSSSTKSSRGGKPVDPAILALIRGEADRQHVPRAIALAFAAVESGFNPHAEGDLNWPTKKDGTLYRQHVLEQARLARNPARDDPAAWHSYGLFQLLAPYHVPAHLHPRELLRPSLNAEIGIRYIAKLLGQAGGDPAKARLAYVGCGLDGKRCSATIRDTVLAAFAAAYEHWNALEQVGGGA